jgi:predicted dehydrogenase
MDALRAGKHVLVEKPITQTSLQAQALIEEADKRRLTLAVDHTFIYTAAVRKLREIVTSGDLGRPYYYDSERINLGLFQSDVNVIWDLAVHDLAILNFIFSDRPTSVSATGMSHVHGKPANVGYLTLYFDSGLIAHINVNWLAPVKLRRTLVGGDRKMVVYDDLEPSEKIKIYDKGIQLRSREDLYEALVGYRFGDMCAPRLDMTEALRREVQHFIECVETRRKPDSSGESGLYVIRVLEAASQSMELRGQPVEIKWNCSK